MLEKHHGLDPTIYGLNHLVARSCAITRMGERVVKVIRLTIKKSGAIFEFSSVYQAHMKLASAVITFGTEIVRFRGVTRCPT